METKQDLSELIDKYINNELSNERRDAFEKSLNENTKLKKEYNLHLLIRKSFENKDELLIRQQLNTLRKKNDNKNIRYKLMYKIAAAALLVLIISTSYYMLIFKSKNIDIYNKYYKTVDAQYFVRGKVFLENNLFSNAVIAYENKNYNQAILLFNNMLDDSEYYVLKEYYTALSFMELQEHDSAIVRLEGLSNYNNNLIYDDALWHLALCYLHTNNTKEAKIIFDLLITSNSVYSNASNNILKSIK